MSSNNRKTSKALSDALALAMEVSGSQRLSQEAAAAMLRILGGYPERAVLAAIERCMREVTGRIVLAHIIERIDDGRPSPSEAWAIVGHADESRTLVTTEEAMEAVGCCRDLLAHDHVGARVAFIERYKTLVGQSRAAGAGVKWVISVGTDKRTSEPAIVEAVKAGRIKASYGAAVLGVSEETLLLPQASRPLSLAGRKRIAELVGGVTGALSGDDDDEDDNEPRAKL